MSASKQSAWYRLTSLVVPSLLLAVACALRFTGLGRFSFDGDEIFSIRAVLGSWPNLFRVAMYDVSHPPLFYILLKVWLQLGPVDEFWVRLLPAIFGSLAVLPLYGICRSLQLAETDRIFVCGLFAVNGSLIYYSQDARMFSLLVLTSVLSIYVFVRYLQASNFTARGMTALITVNVLLVYSHYWGWLVVISEGIVLFVFGRAKLHRFLLSMVWVALAFMPWALAVLFAIVNRGNATSQIRWISEPTSQSIIWFLGDVTGAPDFRHATIVGLVLFALPISVLSARVVSDKRFRSEFQVSPLSWFVLFALPICVTVLAGYISGQSVWGERQLLVVFAPFYILVSIAVRSLSWQKLIAGTQTILMLWSIAAGATVITNPHQRLQWRSLAEFIADNSQPGVPTPIYAAERFESWALLYYLNRPGEPVTQPNPALISGKEFWFVYRPQKWRFVQSPETMFAARGYVAEKTTSTITDSQSIVVVLFRREAR